MQINRNAFIPCKELSELRQELHQNPELSGNEKESAQRIINFTNKYKPDEIITELGGYGVAVLFKGTEPGPTVMIRGDMDALPIQETNELEYRSSISNIAHLCGHDGHTAIIAGLIPLLSEKRPAKGRVVLLFQPAEETGTGAAAVLADPKFKPLQPDYAFALHNLPGFERNEIVLCENEFASASKGIIASLKGKTSHAAEPEKGINPSLAVAEIIPRWLSIPCNDKNLHDFSLLTIIHARIGERAFGTSAGDAEVCATLRSFTNQDMKVLTRKTCAIVQEISFRHHLQHSIEFVEEFPATRNDTTCIAMIEKAALDQKLKIKRLNEPFKWSEDFGHFTQSCKGAMFGLGAGLDHPNLHQPNYDFPDEIIETGVLIFHSLIRQIIG